VAQNNAEDWRLGSRGCYDSASLARLQMKLRFDFPALAAATVAECTSQPLGASVTKALADETLLANPDALGRLMADHTQVCFSLSFPFGNPLAPSHSCPPGLRQGLKGSED
jgi:hypothetical protein